MHTNSILQQKLSPGEIEYLGLIIDGDKSLQRIEGPLWSLDSELESRWPKSDALAEPARLLREKIIDFAATADIKNRGYVRMAMMTGRSLRLIPKDPKAPTQCAVLDLEDGVLRQGPLDPGNPAIGMKVFCQPSNGKTYVDWIGMGVGLDLNPTTTARQRERILMEELATVRPGISTRRPQVLLEKRL